MKDKYRKSVFIVTYRKQGRKILYLLLKRKLHWTGWEFPKGGIEKNETPLLTILRELREEVGQEPVKIQEVGLSGRYDYPKKLKDRPKIKGQTFLLYLAEIKKEKVKIDKQEHSSYKWVDYKEAINLLTYDDQKNSLALVHKKISKKN
ncbi:MAG: NUDIX domain-containing protein [Candidatus Pacearchaeota archaeon]|nr:NUDIX domain-containing protein [Candidatus Pacearchaeota archaeon]